MAKLTDAQRDALWGFLYSSSFNYDPHYDRPQLSKDDFIEVAKAESRRRARGPMSPALVDRLVKCGALERSPTNPGVCLITAAGRAALRGAS